MLCATCVGGGGGHPACVLEVVEVALHVVEVMDDMGRVLEVSEGLGHLLLVAEMMLCMLEAVEVIICCRSCRHGIESRFNCVPHAQSQPSTPLRISEPWYDGLTKKEYGSKL